MPLSAPDGPVFTDLLSAAGSHQSAFVSAADGRLQTVYTHQMDSAEHPSHQTAFTAAGEDSREPVVYLGQTVCQQTEYGGMGEVETQPVSAGQTAKDSGPACSEPADSASGQQLVFADAADDRIQHPAFTVAAQVMDQPLYLESADSTEQTIFSESNDNDRQQIYPESPSRGNQTAYQELSEGIQNSLYQESVENRDTGTPVCQQEFTQNRPAPVCGESLDEKERPVFPPSGRESKELQFSAGESDSDPLDGCPYDGDIDLAGD